MWIFLSEAMFSVVQKDRDPDVLMVRARLRGDIRRVFPGRRVRRTPDADYLYRAEVPRAEVQAVLARAVGEIDYSNFKDTVPRGDRLRHDAYFRVWHAMYDAQKKQAASRRGYRGFPNKEAYEAHYGDVRNYADELPAMREYSKIIG